MSFASRNLNVAAVAAITIPTNWGSQSGASPQQSLAKTLTVPAGNPGNIRLHLAVAPAGTASYIKNGGAPVTLTVDVVVVFVNGDTLAFKLAGPSDDSTTSVTDDLYGVSIGACTLHTT